MLMGSRLGPSGSFLPLLQYSVAAAWPLVNGCLPVLCKEQTCMTACSARILAMSGPISVVATSLSYPVIAWFFPTGQRATADCLSWSAGASHLHPGLPSAYRQVHQVQPSSIYPCSGAPDEACRGKGCNVAGQVQPLFGT